MAKVKTTFFCQSCGSQYSKWQGQCNSCKSWNTISEELIIQPKKNVWKLKSNGNKIHTVKPLKISEIHSSETTRLNCYDDELNRVLGGGIVPGSIILLGGEPGIGKSTLMLQLVLKLSNKTMYISGEESLSQIKLRSDRIGPSNDSCYFLTETNTQNMFLNIEKINPELVVIDSVQTLQSDFLEASSGSVSQLKQTTSEIIKFAKETSISVILIGHINKEGSIAGPKVLEHMVDTVLHFEGDRNYGFRIIRSKKNRFGSTQELGIYEMQTTGLREIKNPSEILIPKRDYPLSGNSIAVTIEGARPLLVEVQALVSSAVYGTPQRSTTGFNSKRLNMLLAVLEKRAGFHLGTKDVFLNIAGGIKVNDPAIDLSVVAAILSSNNDIPIRDDYSFAGEVGLSGEIRPVQRIDQRVIEAEKLGFKSIFISSQNTLGINPKSIKVNLVSQIKDIINIL